MHPLFGERRQKLGQSAGRTEISAQRAKQPLARMGRPFMKCELERPSGRKIGFAPAWEGK